MKEEGKILIAGASGVLGLEIVKLLKAEGKNLRVLTRTDEGLETLSGYTEDIWKEDAAKETAGIKGITKNVTTVISALGKSISLFAPPEASFYENDYKANKNLIDDAVRNKVARFIYISIKGADTLKDYNVARVHKLCENELRNSGLDYTIIRPVGFYSGLNDLAIMAKRKFIPLIGSGKAKTNSIHHKDLAVVVVSFLEKGPDIIEIGGPNIHTRLEMVQMIKEIIGGNIIKIPEPIAKVSARLGLTTILGKGIHDKLDYFTFITTNDMIGEPRGSISFREYLGSLDLKKLS
ncbi:uncharacterized protein YbjT (DUF2867 family) [Salegentibacter sp. 24]|uniref:SDR family oxidoreductase n=1 Tax=Salegentibacter sp. 24 TaxID=2183986 RepID=UPI001060D091|nr:NAD(P)H-binding protein [Salegentibacter sp. 24]TDN94947.1 uncharacterized protein YbjT (DUF2867 family) [Salegentibacter sp. 24]